MQQIVRILFPPLVALASVCHGTSFIKGVSRLAHKESDRALTLQEEFGKLGVDILIHDDMMGIQRNRSALNQQPFIPGMITGLPWPLQLRR